MDVAKPATTSANAQRRSDRQRWWWIIALAAVVIAVGTFTGLGSTRQPNTVVLAQAPPGSSKAGTTAMMKLTPLKRSRPIRLTIPALGIVTGLDTLGLQADHQVMVPTTTHTPGWYIDGPAPGQMGSAVILGHVDSYIGPGVFFELKTLKVGDSIRVQLADGEVTHFVVTRVVEYSKTTFPDGLVYGTHHTESLQLVTCGGSFDHATGHYLSNIVVYSHLVRTSKSKA
jgi:sortase (surface protein transpeptidase)